MPEQAGRAHRGGAIARARAYVEGGAFERDLARRVAFKTESQKLPHSLPQLRAYLEEAMIPAFARLGFRSQIYDNPLPGQGPVLLAQYFEAADLPTVLGYGHGDVIRGLEDQWTKGKGPWVLARDGERLYGRGTADNKGQHTINMAALEAVKAEQVKAIEESADAKERLAAVRKEAAETIKLADAKLAELGKALAAVLTKIDRAVKDVDAATTDDARAKANAALDKLQAQKTELETTIAKIKQLKDELATSSSQ